MKEDMMESNGTNRKLNNAPVNLIRVARKCKNAPDEKLKQYIRRFADIRGSATAVILISFFLGSKISLKFEKEKTSNFQQIQANRNCTVIESEIVTSSPRQMYSASASFTSV